MTPDNLKVNAPFIVCSKGIYMGVFNPVKSLLLKENNLCFGILYENNEFPWHKPKADIPDGTFVIFRSNANYVEAVSDIVGTRTIWYFHSDDLFIASTSHRMIIIYLGKFKPNKMTYSWMLSAGLPGPELSWDHRIKVLPGNAKILLDRDTWETSITVNPIHFEGEKLSYTEHSKNL